MDDIRRRFRPTPALTLLFHRVIALESDPCRLAVSPARFRALLEAVGRRFRVVPAAAAITPARSDRRRVAITFDDGFADNVEGALPVLESLGMPATFFIATDAIGSDREFWWTELERLLLEPVRLPPRLSLQGPIALETDLTDDPGKPWGGHPEWTLDQPPPGSRQSAFAQLAPALQAAPVPIREATLARLRDLLGVGPAGRLLHRAMDAAGLERLAGSSCAALGAHTRRHPRLAGLDALAQTDEIAGSKSALEQRLGRTIDAFAYPYGSTSDYDDLSCRTARESGFTHAFGNHGPLSAGPVDPFRLPRLCVLDWEPAELLARLERFG